MASRQLVARLLGATALCLAILAGPVSPVDRIVALTGVGLGIGFAAVLPAYDRVSVRVAGPAVLALTVVPPSGPWLLLVAVALFGLGFATFDPVGMVRAVPALVVPIAASGLRAGTPPEAPLLVVWLIVVGALLVVHPTAWPADRQPRLTTADRPAPPVVFGWRRAIQGAFVLVVVGPVSLELGAALDARLPDVAATRPRSGDGTGPAMIAHPGLAGTLDAGEPVALSDEIVLRVDADRPMFWRGTTYEEWDGRRWTGEAQRRGVGWTGDGVDLTTLDGPGPQGPPPVEGSTVVVEGSTVVEQTFRLERSGLDVLLGAWRPTAVWTTTDGAWLGADGSLRLDQPLGAGATWTVRSELVSASDDALRAADPLTLDGAHPIRSRYGVEDDVPPRVAALARQITDDAPTTYDKIRAIEAWMDDNLVYTRDIPRLEDGRDVVEHLLFTSRRGYCEQIGSALVVMLRSLGIPARLVVGFVPGSQDRLTGEWLSRGTDAHAWAEVYFPGIGWRGFDPTASVPLSPDAPTDGGRSLAPPAVAITVAAAALAATGLGAVAARRWVARRGRRRRSGPEAAGDELRAALHHLGRNLEASWDESTTVRRMGTDLVAAGVAPEAVGEAVAIIEELWYGTTIAAGGEPADALLERAVACRERLDRLAPVGRSDRRHRSGSARRDVADPDRSAAERGRERHRRGVEVGR